MPAAGNSPRPLSFPVEFSNGYTHATASRHAPAGWWDDAQSIGASIWQSVMKMERRLLSAFFRLRPAQRIVAVVFSVLLLGLGIAILIYSESLFSLVAPLAQSWRKVTGGWLVLWLLTFAVAFPPLIGYSACVTAAGFVYGLRSG